MSAVQTTKQVVNPWTSGPSLRDRLQPPVQAVQTAGKIQAAGIEPVKAAPAASLLIPGERVKEIVAGSKEEKRTFADIVAASARIATPAAATIPVLEEPHPFARMAVSEEERKAAFAASTPRVVARTTTVAASRIFNARFSQTSVAKETQGEMSLNELKVSIRNNWTGPRLPLVQFDDGSLTSIGNRRLLVCHWIIHDHEKGEGAPLRNVPAIIHPADEPADENWLETERNQYFQYVSLSHRENPQFRRRFEEEYESALEGHGIQRGTYGELIFLRSRDRRANLNENVRGFESRPHIRH